MRRFSVVAVSALLVFATTAFAGAPPVSHWGFDEASGTTSADLGTPGGYPAVFDPEAATPPTRIAGHCGGALHFDGISWSPGAGKYVKSEVDTEGPPLETTSGSISVWVYSEDDTWHTDILGSGDGLQDYRWLVHYPYAGAEFGFCVEPYCPTRVFTHDGAVPPAGEWTHVVHTWDLGEQHLYMNGVVVASSYVPLPPGLTWSHWEIGGLQAGIDAQWTGAIDELKMFDYPLSADQVLELYDDQVRDLALVEAFFPTPPQIGTVSTMLAVVRNVGGVAMSADVHTRLDGALVDVQTVVLQPCSADVVEISLIGELPSHDLRIELLDADPADQNPANGVLELSQIFSSEPPPPDVLSCTRILPSGRALGLGGPACAASLTGLSCQLAGPGNDLVELGGFRGETFVWDVECSGDGDLFHYASE